MALQLALRWAPFGGPPSEEIFLGLGITDAQYWRWLKLAVDRAPCTVLNDHQRAMILNLIRDFCLQQHRR